MTDKKRISWYIFVRLMVVSLFLTSTIILNIKYPFETDSNTFSGFIKLIVATYLFSLISLYALKFEKAFRSLAHAQIIWDLFLVTLLILLTGVVTSPYSFLYFLCIVNSSVLLARKEAIYTASLCAILYGSLLDLQYFNHLAAFGVSATPAQQFGAQYILFTIFLNTFNFFLTAFLTGYLAERTRKSEKALSSKEIDYEELDLLNSSIVANLNSGLLTLNTEARIRVFNQYAVSLTGISQTEAYDKYLHDIFPNICYLGGALNDIHRGEFRFDAPHGETMTIGFKSVPLTDCQGAHSGVIVIFQDLTQLKSMEEELKKADRLSAIGQLSAHIAHEIRNPLASISGSVQLLAHGEGIGAKDRKLIEIVVRETDRLNNLIRDFLGYARPITPTKRSIHLNELLSSVKLLVGKDPRFSGCRIDIKTPDNISILADYDQLEQVFWNLLVNAAEAMPEGGSITISANVAGPLESKKARIIIADTGIGMDKEETGRVFEPFFTTKKGGTGLGLATVYRLIEAHSGTIVVESAKGAGTQFIIQIPIAGIAAKEQRECSHVF